MPNATQMIRQDHKKVEGLFKKFEQTKGAQAKRRLAEDAMAELEVHAALEEEIFYPAVKKEVDDGSMVQEAIEEHQTVKQLISELKGMDEADEEFESQFSQLVENVQHHVEEEENEMLPKAEQSSLDLNSLGQQMSQRKREMQSGGRATKKTSNARSSRKSPGSKSTRRKSAGKKASSKTAARKTGGAKKTSGRKATKKSGSRSRRRA
ncbi:MAG TPA: hemerythrin domain-containing protein [Candidatus Binatia bacterium]|nr:hemerythrin domain-containing protein [Candidatus Binatia bacterium]